MFLLVFPIMGACCAQIKGFTLGCRELVLVRPNVKPFYLNPIGFAPIDTPNPLFILVNNIVGSARNLQSLRMFLYEGVDMADALALENFVHGDEDACLLHVAETVVDGGAEELHCG